MGPSPQACRRFIVKEKQDDAKNVLSVDMGKVMEWKLNLNKNHTEFQGKKHIEFQCRFTLNC